MRTIKKKLALALALLCSLCCLSAATAQQPKDLIQKTFDMTFMKEAMTGQVHSSFELPLRASLAARSIEAYVMEARGSVLEPQGFSIDEAIEVIRRACLTTDEDEEFTRIRASDNKLIVVAPSATVKKIKAMVTFIEELLTRNVTVEIASIDSAAFKAPNQGLMSEEEVAELLKTAHVIHRQRAMLSLGQIARLDASRTRQYVVDYDVEVAEKARIADPVVAALIEGTQFGVQVEECPDGRYLMRVQGRVCRRVGKDRIVQSPASDVGAIELPKTSSAVVAMNAVVTPGSGFLIGSHEAGNNPWLVRLISVDPRPTAPTFKMIAGGVLNRQVFVPKIKTVIGPRRSGDDGGFENETEENCVFPADEIIDSMTDFFESSMDEEFQPSIMSVGQDIFVRANANVTAKMQKAILDYVAPVLKNVSTELRYDLIDDSALSGLLDSSPEQMAAKLGRQARIFARTGSRGLVVSGREWLTVKDKDVEIASGSQISNPVIDALFEGVVFGAQSSITPSGDIAMAVDFTVQANTNQGRVFETGLSDVGSVDTDDLTHVHGNARFKAKRDKWTLVHTAPLAGTGTTFVLMARGTID